MGTRSRFTSRGPHPYVFFAAPFGLVLLACAGAGSWLGASDASTAFGVTVGTLFGTWVLASCAYSAWGVVELARDQDEIALTKRLGGLTRTSRFRANDVVHVEEYTPTPAAIIFPGGAGRHLQMTVRGRNRPVSIGEGLCLDTAELHSIRDLICESAS